MALIKTEAGLHLVLKGMPYTVSKTDKAYEAVVEAVNRKASDDEILDILEGVKRRLEAATELTPDIRVRGGQVYYKDQPVDDVLSTRMVQMLEEGFDLQPMARFIENLMKNPSFRVVTHLYKFLEVGKNPITEDGCFLAYKAVRADYRDIHSGTFDNSIGAKPEMPRHMVNDDPDKTCSQGLHVCSFDYLPYFSHANGHVMVCKVNPADVVAIPRDENNTKMRVCRYEVVGEYEGYYKDRGDALANCSVASDEWDRPAFSVEILEDGNWVFNSGAASLTEAAHRMEELSDDTSIEAVRVVNNTTKVVVDERHNPDYEPDEDYSDDDYVDNGYALYGIGPDGKATKLSDGYVDLADAVADALEHTEFSAIEVRTENGDVVKTLS